MLIICKKSFLAVFVLTLFLLSNSCFAWWGTGHQLVAQIAYTNLAPEAKRQINTLLNSTLSWPNANYTQYLPYPSQLAGTLSTVRLASTWPDAIKSYYWNGSNGFEVKTAYSNLHFIDTPITQESRNKCNSVDWLNLEQGTVKDTNGDNVVSGVKSSIKTLLSTESQEKKNIALRFLLHLVGDLHMPYHSSNPEFTFQQHLFGTYGANEIKLLDDSDASIYQYPLPAAGDVGVNEFHQLWDAAVGAYHNLPDDYNSSYDRQARLDWQQYGNYYNNFFIAEANNIQTIFSSNQQLNKLIKNDPEIDGWAAATANVACNLLSADKFDLIFTPYSYISKGQTLYAVKVQFMKGIATYQTQTKLIALQQIYMAGMRLANLLNAIFAPDAFATNPYYVHYIRHKIVRDDHIVPLDELIGHAVSLEDKKSKMQNFYPNSFGALQFKVFFR